MYLSWTDPCLAEGPRHVALPETSVRQTHALIVTSNAGSNILTIVWQQLQDRILLLQVTNATEVGCRVLSGQE